MMTRILRAQRGSMDFDRSYVSREKPFECCFWMYEFDCQ